MQEFKYMQEYSNCVNTEKVTISIIFNSWKLKQTIIWTLFDLCRLTNVIMLMKLFQSSFSNFFLRHTCTCIFPELYRHIYGQANSHKKRYFYCLRESLHQIFVQPFCLVQWFLWSFRNIQILWLWINRMD